MWAQYAYSYIHSKGHELPIPPERVGSLAEVTKRTTPSKQRNATKLRTGLVPQRRVPPTVDGPNPFRTTLNP